MYRSPILPTLVLLWTLGCGGKVVFVDDGETGGGGAAPASSGVTTGGLDCANVLSDFDAPTLACTDGSDTCELIGTLLDGRRVRESCDATPRCVLYIDDMLTCTCPADRIDWANVCPNAVPTCAGWQFNRANAGLCIID